MGALACQISIIHQRGTREVNGVIYGTHRSADEMMRTKHWLNGTNWGMYYREVWRASVVRPALGDGKGNPDHLRRFGERSGQKTSVVMAIVYMAERPLQRILSSDVNQRFTLPVRGLCTH